MFKSKFVAFVAAATLVVTPGLVACGGSQSDDSAKEETAVEQAEEATEKEAEEAGNPEQEAEIIEWAAEGTTDDGVFGVSYYEARTSEGEPAVATLVLTDIESGISAYFTGEFTEADGKDTITDVESGATITYTIPDLNTETGEVKFTIDEKGDTTLVMVEDMESFAKDLEAIIGASAANVAAAEAAEAEAAE